MRRFRRYTLFWIVFAVFLAFDQLTKLATAEWIEIGRHAPPITIIPGFFNLIHVHNTGAAFSIFAGHRWPLVALGVVALVGIFYWRRAIEIEKPIVQWAFGLLVSGIVGNLIDRILFGYVIDFLDFDLPFYGRWPTFNIADICINAGVGLYILYSIFRKKTAHTGDIGEKN